MTFLTHNGTIVPWTTPWTGEDGAPWVEREHYTGGAHALCQKDTPGEGKPIFGAAHYQRQRKAIIQGRCDVCGRAIRPGQARVLLHPGNQLKGTAEVGHVMAPSHRECARLAAQVCPWIVGEIKAGKLVVTVVRAARYAIAILDPEVVEAETGQRHPQSVVGHAKLIVDSSLRRDAAWLIKKEMRDG